jgi:hypothetical protein
MKKLFLVLLFPIFVFSQDTISKPKLSVISLDKVKIVYRGIDNPITVSVPNAKEYWVSGPGVSKTDELGKYVIRPGIGTELKIVVAIKFEDDSIVNEEHVYYIKNIPFLVTTINNEFSTQGYLEFSLEDLKNAEVGVKFIDFLFPLYPIVSGFTLKIPNKEDYYNEGNILTEEAINLIKKARKKDNIIITNIKSFFLELIKFLNILVQ